MKKYILYFLYFFLLFLLQVSSTKVFSDYLFIIPQFVLLFVIIFALSNSFIETLWFSFIAGFLSELFSGLFFGSQISAFLVIGLGVYLATRNLAPREITVPTVIVLVVTGTLLYELWLFVFGYLASVSGLSSALSFKYFFSTKLVWTVLLNLLFFYPLNFLFKHLPKE